MEAVGQLGYDHALYAARFMLTVPRALLRDNPVVFSNLPPDLIEQAQRLRDLDQDPWVEWVRDNDGDIASDALQDQFGPSRSFGLAAEHGLGHARIISLRDKVLHSVGAVVVMPRQGADAQDLQASWARSGREVRVLSWVMHMRIATMQRNLPKATLTPRQREVLGWRSAGKTVGEIAVILGITAATVEKHMRLAREALGVETTPQAVLKAHVTHQLFQPAAASLRLGGQG
ncbi:LuxR family transcriptional regulator [Paracoccus sp. NFXS7]|uniref:helix-turn-helix transcriptional regulator n=1 Tax=Paracoccus sp. NFXS7 TaxID=2908653 RepID=UPI0032DE9398